MHHPVVSFARLPRPALVAGPSACATEAEGRGPQRHGAASPDWACGRFATLELPLVADGAGRCPWVRIHGVAAERLLHVELWVGARCDWSLFCLDDGLGRRLTAGMLLESMAYYHDRPGLGFQMPASRNGETRARLRLWPEVQGRYPRLWLTVEPA